MDQKAMYQRPESTVIRMEIEGEVFTPSVPSSDKNPGGLLTPRNSMLDLKIDLSSEKE